MHYLNNGRIIPGFENEDVTCADAPIDVDIEQLSADLENAQACILEESNKYSSALEAMDELENTIGEIEVAMESDVDLVTAQLLVNSLNKHSNVLYGEDLKSAGLQSDSTKDVLEAGLLDAKGMMNAVKEFIAKVWQKIKDAFAFVWKKMKDFWAWLTGANKKVEEKLEETIIAAATVEAAETKAEDIKKAKEDVRAGKNTDDSLKRFRRRQELKKASKSKASKSSDDSTHTFLLIKDGKFKGREITDLSQSEFNEWMSGSKENEEIIIDAVIEDIIVEEVSKTTGIDEEKVNRLMPVSISKLESFFTYNPKLQSDIAKTLNSNFSGNETVLSTITEKLVRLAFFEMSSNVNNSFQGAFKYTPASIQEDYKKFEKDYSLLDRVLGNMGSDAAYSSYVEQIIGRIFKSGYLHNESSDYLDTVSASINQLSIIVESLKNGIMADWSISHTASVPVEIKNFIPLIPISITKENIIFTNAVTMYKISTADIPNFSFKNFENNIRKYKFTDKVVSDITKIKIADDKKYFSKQQEQSNRLKQSLDNLVVVADAALDGIEKAYEKNMKDADNGMKKDWNNIKFSITAFVGHAKSFSPSMIIEQAKINSDCLSLILDMIDLPRTIAQATKEGK